MKRPLITCLVYALLIPNLFSQEGDDHRGGRFTKTIGYNLLVLEDTYNLESKSDIEKLLFGKYNSPVEFFHIPSSGEYAGFRIVRDSAKTSYTLEVKYITNYVEARHIADTKYPLINTPLSLDKFQNQYLSEDEKELLSFRRNREERIKLYNVEILSLPITEQFAEKLHDKMASVIDNFKAGGVPPHIFDGYEVTFRTVVEDEVWSLKVQAPGGNACTMSDLCIQIIEDVKNDTFKETKYIKLLDF